MITLTVFNKKNIELIMYESCELETSVVEIWNPNKIQQNPQKIYLEALKYEPESIQWFSFKQSSFKLSIERKSILLLDELNFDLL